MSLQKGNGTTQAKRFAGIAALIFIQLRGTMTPFPWYALVVRWRLGCRLRDSRTYTPGISLQGLRLPSEGDRVAFLASTETFMHV